MESCVLTLSRRRSLSYRNPYQIYIYIYLYIPLWKSWCWQWTVIWLTFIKYPGISRRKTSFFTSHRVVTGVRPYLTSLRLMSIATSISYYKIIPQRSFSKFQPEVWSFASSHSLAFMLSIFIVNFCFLCMSSMNFFF